MSDRSGRWLLACLLLFEFLVLSQGLAGRPGRPPLIERAALRILGPLAHAVAAAEGGVEGVVARGRREQTLRDENRLLHERIEVLERELLRRQSVELDFQRLATALRYSRDAERELRVGDVVFLDPSSAHRTVILFVGEGAEVGQTVVDPSGIVGRVVVASGGYAKVQLVTDPASAVGVMLERTRRQGVVRGVGSNLLTLDYVPVSADVRVGDRVVSAGIDGIFPRGLTVGLVESVRSGNDLFQRIAVRPAVDFGLLDSVYVLPRLDPPLASKGDFDAGS